MLTKSQHELLQFIVSFQDKKGFSPSFDEMREHMGLKSKSGIHRLVTGLEERGFIYHTPDRARCIEVLRVPVDGGGYKTLHKPAPTVKRLSDALANIQRQAASAGMTDLAAYCNQVLSGSRM